MGSYNAFKETRLNLDPKTQNSTISIRLPQHGASTSSKAQRRFETSETSIAEDENTFRRKNLATAASVYHRKHHKIPKSFLWRILEDGKVLSVRAVDVSKQAGVAEANLTLRFYFTHAIKPGCIAFSDSKEHDVLSAFVLTDDNSLFTLSLRPDHFRRASGTEDGVGDWCKSYLSGQFGFKKAFRLVALGADEILLSYTNGELTRLTRKSGGDGSSWSESHYRENQWHALKSYFKGGPRIPYGKDALDLPAATSIASPSVEIDGVPYAFAVSVDHQLRIWNISTGRVAYVGDITEQEMDTNDIGKQVIDPSHFQLVKVIGNEENVICVTYSPLGTGEFKFWSVSAAPDDNVTVIDMFDHARLSPKAPTSDLWTLADFAVQNRSGMNKFTLWTLWKNNTTYQVQRLKFGVGPNAWLREAWADGWEAMVTETLRETPLPAVYHGDASDATDKWLDFIMTPGRFTFATLETGLAIYERGLGESREVSRKTRPLAQRMCSIIASPVVLGRTSEGHMDFEQFRRATDTQWRRFYRLLVELDKQRGEALSLVVGDRGELPLVALADGISAIRVCSSLERIWHNPEAVKLGEEHAATLIMSAAAFRDAFNDQLLHSCDNVLLGELFEEPTLVDPTRMRLFYEKCDFANQIGEDEYAQLVANLGGTFKDVTFHVYEGLLNLMGAVQSLEKRDQVHPLAEYGNKLVVRGVQETIELHRSICLDQLVLLVLIEAEINHGEEGLAFETGDVFHQLIAMLKRLELISWLSNTQIALPISRAERSTSATDRSSFSDEKGTPATETITVLEGVLRHLFGLDTRKDESMSYALTEVITQICAPDSEYEAPPAVIQCFLLKNCRPDLALEFSKFAANDPFSTYIQGRACLAAGDAQTASMLFKKAAFGIGFPDSRKRTDHRSAGYLDEMERNLLNAGLPQYYSHIVTLFDKSKDYSYVIDFARLSLQFIGSGAEGPLAQLRTDVHGRYFNAALHTNRCEMAHSILTLFIDPALRHSSLRSLITKMCETSYASDLVDLPFIGMQDMVDDILSQKSHSIVEVTTGVPYHKILYAWRIKRGDFRGAASVSLERLQKLQQAGEGDRISGEDGFETPITKQYVVLINALSCVDPKQAWIFSEEVASKAPRAGAKAAVKRKVVTLGEIRKSYQDELDRIAAIENNQFAFGGPDEMDVL